MVAEPGEWRSLGRVAEPEESDGALGEWWHSLGRVADPEESGSGTWGE